MSRQMLGPHRPPSPAAERPRGGLAVGKHPTTNIQPPTSNHQHPTTNIQPPTTLRDSWRSLTLRTLRNHPLGGIVCQIACIPQSWASRRARRENIHPPVTPPGARLCSGMVHSLAVCACRASLVRRSGVLALAKEPHIRPPPRRLPNKKNDKSYGIPRVSVICGIVCQNLVGLVGPPATMRKRWENQGKPTIPKATCLFPLAAGLFGYLKTSGFRYDFQ